MNTIRFTHEKKNFTLWKHNFLKKGLFFYGSENHYLKFHNFDENLEQRMLKIKNLNLSNIIKINKTKNFIITKHQYIFENNEKKFCYKKLKSVLKKWHKNNLLHGDLKPEHFIFHDNTVTLIDPISKPKKFSGTYHFLCFFEKLGFKTRWTENLNLKLIIKRI